MNSLRPILPTDLLTAAFALAVWATLVYRVTLACGGGR